jgi:RNA polymerase sigma-70 factor (ECF subfamily)
MENVKFLNEKVLIASLQKGDKFAFTRLYTLFYPEMCAYMTVICKDDDRAKEIVQQSLIKIWRKRKSLNVKKSLKHYLFKIAYHQYVDAKRKEKKKFLFLEQLKGEATQELIEYSDSLNEQRLKFLEREIEDLPPQCKKVFLLGKRDGLKYREIALQLKISKKTVELHMGKALKRIRKKLRNGDIPHAHNFFLCFSEPPSDSDFT